MIRSAFCALLLSMAAEAAQLNVVNVVGTGTFNNSTALIHDGAIPAQGSVWNLPDKVWWNTTTTPTFTLDLGAIYLLQDFVVSLDNNDTYRFQYSTDNVTYNNLVDVSSAFGEIGGGMDTFSSVFGNPDYVAGVDFTATSARYVRVFATAGDNSYSTGEIQLFGESAVPEPSTFVLLTAGLGLFLMRRK